MAINIKELFSTDSSTDQLDKINYNFDQVVANGGGPIGATGAKGELGAQGNKGQKGELGLTGPQGDPGIATDYLFRNDNGTKFTYTPIPDDLASPLGYTKPASLILGDAPMNLGMSNQETDALLYVKQFEHPYLAKFGTDDTDEYVTLSITADGADRVVTWAPTALGTSTQKWVFNGDTIALNDGTGEIIKLDKTASEIASNLEISGNLAYTSGSLQDGYVLTSDNSGNATWQAPYETPVGTIVMVPKFVLQHPTWINWQTTGLPGQDYVGRGNSGGPWEGWYYCWGRTWGTYETPDMREAMPLGYVRTEIQGTGGYSPEVYNPNTTVVTNAGRIDDLQSFNIDTAYNHTHTTNIGNMSIEEEIDGNPVGTNVLQPQSGGSSNFISGNPSTSSNLVNVNVVPPGTVVGYMIYLGTASLTYGGAVITP